MVLCVCIASYDIRTILCNFNLTCVKLTFYFLNQQVRIANFVVINKGEPTSEPDG